MEPSTNKVSQHFGAVGERGRWVATYVRSASFPGTHFHTGAPCTRWMHKFLVDESNVAIWWTSSPLDLMQDEQVILVGSIKKHDEYNGTAQTVLSRCGIHQVLLCEACGAPLLEKEAKCPSCKSRGSAGLF